MADPDTGQLLRGRTPFLMGLGLCLCLSTGCKTYSERVGGALNAYEAGNLDRAMNLFEDKKLVGSRFLSGVEAGMVAWTAGDWDRAQASLDRACAETEEIEGRALVSATDLGQSLLTWATNDTTKDYRGEGYERVMAHTLLSMCYLARGDLSAAQVEVRRSDKLLTTEQELYEKDYRAGGLGHLLSALCYELEGSLDQAYIDYGRMLEKNLGADLAGPAAQRIARTLSYTDVLPGLESQYGAQELPPENAARVVLIAGVGRGPEKIEHSLLIPSDVGALRWAVPAIKNQAPTGQRVRLTCAGVGSVDTVVVEDVGRVAEENLGDRIAWLAGKSAMRALLKRELTQELQHHAQGAGWLAGQLFSVLTERADLRSWRTLPATWQAANLYLSPGDHELRIGTGPSSEVPLGTFRLQAGETLFLFARSIGGSLFGHVIGGEEVDPSSAQVQGTQPEFVLQGASNPSPLASTASN